jgi:anthranilate phosphoribosyltransferase
LLLRGTEGEPVADPRRMPRMDGFAQGRRTELQALQDGSLQAVPNLPAELHASSNARYISAVLSGELACPAPVKRQVECVLHMLKMA